MQGSPLNNTKHSILCFAFLQHLKGLHPGFDQRDLLQVQRCLLFMVALFSWGSFHNFLEAMLLLLLLLLSRFSSARLCDPIEGSPPGSTVPGILQARTMEWVAISFSNAWRWKVKVKSLSRVRLFTTPWTAAHQAPPSVGFSRQECWSGVPLPSPGGHATGPLQQICIMSNILKPWETNCSLDWNFWRKLKYMQLLNDFTHLKSFYGHKRIIQECV